MVEYEVVQFWIDDVKLGFIMFHSNRLESHERSKLRYQAVQANCIASYLSRPLKEAIYIYICLRSCWYFRIYILNSRVTARLTSCIMNMYEDVTYHKSNMFCGVCMCILYTYDTVSKICTYIQYPHIVGFMMFYSLKHWHCNIAMNNHPFISHFPGNHWNLQFSIRLDQWTRGYIIYGIVCCKLYT